MIIADIGDNGRAVHSMMVCYKEVLLLLISYSFQGQKRVLTRYITNAASIQNPAPFVTPALGHLKSATEQPNETYWCGKLADSQGLASEDRWRSKSTGSCWTCRPIKLVWTVDGLGVAEPSPL